MNSTSLDITSISLQNSDNSSSVKLQTGIKSSENSHIIIVSLSPADLNYIKFRTNLATHTFNTYLFLFPSELTDMNSNVLIYRNSSIMVQDLILDTTPPFLLSYDLDLSNNSLILTFSEVINASSLDLSFFLLSSSQSLLIDTQSATFTGGYKSGPSLTSGHPPIIFISLLHSDTNHIKMLNLLARDNTSTFLSISPGAAYDYFNNSLTAININTSLSVTKYIGDMVDPMLVSFSLDLDSLILTLYFSETIQVSSLVISIISLKTTKNFVNDSYSLFDTSLLVDINEPMVNLSLGYTDRNSIKLNKNLCTQQTNCFLAFNSSLIRDTNGNYITQIPRIQAISVSTFISDSTKPSLLNAFLDLDSFILSLYFDEPVDSSSLNLTQITIQSIPGIISNTSDYETFSDGDFPIYSSSNSTNGLFINIFIGTTNLFSIQRNILLATTSSNSYISFTSSLIQDMNRNPINYISPLNATQLSFTPDITEPMLQNFSLDLNTAYLNLFFDEVIPGNFINPSLMILSSVIQYENSATFVRLSHLSIVPLIYHTHISIILSKEDLDSIKLSSTLATKLSNTYLTLEDNCLVDTAIPGNIY
ncbi:hypothetical protein LOD99_2130 [Oopsacas minuta]|uniref:Uncharacterized protein n=1 Tax=Oopsacas minuta TaxID=111878 RepID=A0AAV7K3D6_9METZ|nr:hypothetical protein LOD99_2130 [Oopsacas minuta]